MNPIAASALRHTVGTPVVVRVAFPPVLVAYTNGSPCPNVVRRLLEPLLHSSLTVQSL